MEVIDTIPLQLASLLIFIGSLAVGYILLMLRDVTFGRDSTKGDHHIDFNKKIEEEEELNLNVLGRSSKKLNTKSIIYYNSTEHSEEAKEPTGRYNHKMSGSNSNNLKGKES